MEDIFQPHIVTLDNKYAEVKKHLLHSTVKWAAIWGSLYLWFTRTLQACIAHVKDHQYKMQQMGFLSFSTPQNCCTRYTSQPAYNQSNVNHYLCTKTKTKAPMPRITLKHTWHSQLPGLLETSGPCKMSHLTQDRAGSESKEHTISWGVCWQAGEWTCHQKSRGYLFSGFQISKMQAYKGYGYF